MLEGHALARGSSRPPADHDGNCRAVRRVHSFFFSGRALADGPSGQGLQAPAAANRRRSASVGPWEMVSMWLSSRETPRLNGGSSLLVLGARVQGQMPGRGDASCINPGNGGGDPVAHSRSVSKTRSSETRRRPPSTSRSSTMSCSMAAALPVYHVTVFE